MNPDQLLALLEKGALCCMLASIITALAYILAHMPHGDGE